MLQVSIYIRALSHVYIYVVSECVLTRHVLLPRRLWPAGLWRMEKGVLELLLLSSARRVSLGCYSGFSCALLMDRDCLACHAWLAL